MKSAMGTLFFVDQELPMKKIHLPLVFLVLVASASVGRASEPNAIRGRLPHDAILQGFPCAHGDAWFYPDGALNQCTLARPATLGDLRVPPGSVIELWPSGAPHYLMLPRETVLAGFRIRGGTRLDRSRGATTAFYRNGGLRSFYLGRNQLVQGVPCRGGSWNTLSDPSGGQNLVEFYDDGKLASCKLTRDYSGLRTGQRILLPHLTTAPDVAKIATAQ
jgi:hypothetical protein